MQASYYQGSLLTRKGNKGIMEWRRSTGLLLLVLLAISFTTLTVVSATEVEEFQRALETLLRAGSEIDLQENHINNVNEMGDVPKSYQRILDSLREEAETCDYSEEYRRADGVCNNLDNPLWGAVLHHQIRLIEKNAYLDGVNIPRLTGRNNLYLPSARNVSLSCHPPNFENEQFWDHEATQMSMQFGQYIDHDIVFTEVQTGSDCCSDPRHTCIHPDSFDGGPCFPIGIDEDTDRFFNESCMSFKRSFSVPVNGVHEQISGVTSTIDASTVYGSYQTLQNNLRTGYSGLLKTEQDDFLPLQGHLKCRKAMLELSHCPGAGDMRANVFMGLHVMHLMFVREHNRIAEKLALLNPCWGDEKLFQETRKIIIALHQVITYTEYLPHILGEETMDKFDLNPGNYKYDKTVNTGVLNEFSTAAFRFGHSQINSKLTVDGKSVDISQTFFRPLKAEKSSEDQIRSILHEQTMHRAQAADKFFSQQVSDKLFLDVDAKGHSTDLVSRNIQRGRDHGILPYVDYLDFCISKFLNEKNITAGDLKLPNCSPGSYSSVFDIDLFVGGMYEDHLKGARVGPTFAFIIAQQFRNLKFGDRFFYETNNSNIGFTAAQRETIETQSLAHILCRNSDMTSSQDNVFLSHKVPKNYRKPCYIFKDMDLSLWLDPTC